MGIGHPGGQNGTGNMVAANAGHQRHLSHSGNSRVAAMSGGGPQPGQFYGAGSKGPDSASHMANGPPGGQLAQAQQYRGDGQQAAMSKTGMSFQKRM